MGGDYILQVWHAGEWCNWTGGFDSFEDAQTWALTNMPGLTQGEYDRDWKVVRVPEDREAD